MNNSLYADSIGKFSGETFLESGIFFPAGDGKVTLGSKNGNWGSRGSITNDPRT
jgi:hypothetical protein